jgi:hypothetical protein
MVQWLALAMLPGYGVERRRRTEGRYCFCQDLISSS